MPEPCLQFRFRTTANTSHPAAPTKQSKFGIAAGKDNKKPEGIMGIEGIEKGRNRIICKYLLCCSDYGKITMEA